MRQNNLKRGVYRERHTFLIQHRHTCTRQYHCHLRQLRYRHASDAAAPYIQAAINTGEITVEVATRIEIAGAIDQLPVEEDNPVSIAATAVLSTDKHTRQAEAHWERVAAIKRLMRLLPEEDQQVMAFRYYEEFNHFKHEEIAKFTGKTVKSVKHQRSLKMKKDENRKKPPTTKGLKIFLCILGVMITFSVCRRIYEHQRDKAFRAEPVKVYKTTPQSAKPAIKETTKVEDADNVVSDPASAPMESDKIRDSSESESAIVSESRFPDRGDEATDASEKSKNSEDAEKAKAEQAEQAERRAALQKRLAETDALLEEAYSVIEDGKASLHQAGIPLANHLNSLSIEQQVTFLEQTRTQFRSQLPKEADPVAIEKGWQMYLDMLAEAGYTPPRDFQ